MDFLNKSLAQIGELFRSMTPGARLTAGLLLAVVIVSMGYLFRQGAAGPDAYLFGGAPLSDDKLTNIEAAIAKAGLTGCVREGNRIRVPAGQQAAYLAAVADGGALPPNFNTILESALDKGTAWESRESTRERLKVARQQTLSEIVPPPMHWVEDAVVLYDEQESRVTGHLGATKQTTASVNVKPALGETLDARRAKMLQKLVASAVNMIPKDVNVTSLGDGGVYGPEGTVSFDSFEDEYYQTKIAFEMQKRERIMDALRDIPGVRVEVNAELDETVEESTRNFKPDKTSSAPSHVTEVTEKTSQATTKGGGQPGPVASGPTRQGATATPQQNTSESTNGTEQTTYVVSVEENRTLKKGYIPKEVWAIVNVPSSYLESLWKQRNPTATAPPKRDDLAAVETEVRPKVENIVEPLLKLQALKGETTYKHVTVVFLDSLAAPAIQPPSMASKATSWLSRSWSTLAMLGVAMFSLMVMRSVVSGKPGDPTSTATGAPTLTLQTEEPAARKDNAEEPADDRPRLRLKKGKSLKDDLVEIVHEDPDAAADILRAWIGKAG